MAKLTKLLDRILQERQARNPYAREESRSEDITQVDSAPGLTREELIAKDREMFLGKNPGQPNVYEKTYTMPTYERMDRAKYFRFGRYQKPIVRIFLLTLFGACFLLSLLILMFNRDWVNMALYNGRPFSVQFVKQFHIYILIGVWAAFVYLLFWASQTINRTLGAFERIVKELDAILDGKSHRSIRARENDYPLIRDLAKRINAILNKLPPSDSKPL